MASSPKVSRTRFHSRSVSLSSRPHPFVPEFDEILIRLASSSAASSSSPVRNHLDGLHDLHDCLDSLLRLPESQQALAKECHCKLVDEVLDGSLRLLDVCGTAKDSLLLTKECIQELQSALRRKGIDAKEAGRYLSSRKIVKKSIQKALRKMKNLQSKIKEQEDPLYMVSMLKQVEQATLSVLESVLSLISGPKEKSLVSKLMQSKQRISESENENEFQKVDAAIQSITGQKSLDIEDVHSDLASLELATEDLEFGIECLHKHLIKTRVSLLNILSQ